jgi:pyruvate formate-lyase/glycerol dehydratase family glycyl radical enzyme
MQFLSNLKAEMAEPTPSKRSLRDYWLYLGFAEGYTQPVPIARAMASASLFEKHKKHIYKNDRIAGSLRGAIFDMGEDISDETLQHAKRIVQSFGANTFVTNADHFCADYVTFLQEGIPGTLERIYASLMVHAEDEKRVCFLRAAEIAMQGFAKMVAGYGEAALARAAEKDVTAEQRNELTKVGETCLYLVDHKPETFRQALQLVFLTHTAFLYEERYAMALGRMDQYLWPFYEKDLACGRITKEEARSLLECTFYKIGERQYKGGDDVVNIAIGGRKRDGTGGVNELSYLIIDAVRNCNIPGPNLSARIYDGIPDAFLDACLQSIGTGLGYPALMNDEINIPALHRHGYAIEDARDYCMVGCIENFLPGQQPPWSDGRYNSPKYLELAINNGKCLQTGVQMGPKTGEPHQFANMKEFIEAVEAQMEFGAAEYMRLFKNENERYNKIQYTQPFLSCFCQDCIGRGLDINDGGALYPSVHGAGCMGIATMADSLAAVEQLVFEEKKLTLSELRKALTADFVGFEELHKELLQAPKYGNNDDRVDKYAVWYVEVHDKIFSHHRTWDGGAVYTAIASNVSNIGAGREVAATPDGRKNGTPLSDAASPMRGCDVKGPTAVVLSTTKPDYRLVSCGTVLNQKFGPEMFADPVKRAKLLALIKVYFKQGGQEMQINAVSKDTLRRAMEHPEEYKSLVVRVSGFSAYFTQLDRHVQEDILQRTEHGV